MTRFATFMLTGLVAWYLFTPAEASAQGFRPVTPVTPVMPVQAYTFPWMNNSWQTDPWMYWNLRHGWPYYPSYYTYWPPQYQDYYAPQTTTQQTGTPAYIRILVPDPQAAVWVDGHETSSRGDSRLYVTPPLENGSSHRYKVSALWQRSGKTTTVERDVQVGAGETITVDFTRPAK